MELDNNTVIMQAPNTVILKRASLTHTLKATLDTLTADDFHSIMATYRKDGPSRQQVINKYFKFVIQYGLTCHHD